MKVIADIFFITSLLITLGIIVYTIFNNEEEL
jgi:hypothetical protein